MQDEADTRATALRFADHISNLRFLDAFGMLAENGRYIVPGTTPVSRTYNGRNDLLENLVPVLTTFIEPPTLTFQEPIIDADRAVLLASGRGVGPTGVYDQPYYCFVTRVMNGEFAEIVEFMDLKMLETAVFGRSARAIVG